MAARNCTRHHAASASGEAVEADGVAERFARVFLTDDPDIDRRAARLAAFGLPSDALTGDQPGRTPDVARWTAVVASRASAQADRVVAAAERSPLLRWRADAVGADAYRRLARELAP